MQNLLDHTIDGISQSLENFNPQLTTKEVGIITSLSTGIVKVSGVPGVGFEELLKFPGDQVSGTVLEMSEGDTCKQ